MQVLFDPVSVRISKRALGHEHGRIVGEAVDQHFWAAFVKSLRSIGPNREHIIAAVGKHAACFGVTTHLVGEEHRTELADHEVEGAVVEWEFLCIGLRESELDPS